jgi:phage terminase large subunit
MGGIGSGKTAAGAVWAVRRINAGEDGIIVAPDFPQLSRSTWPEFTKWAPMSRCTNAHLDHPFTQKKQLKFNVRGKVVTVYYGGIEDEEGWAGPNVNWAWFDEGGRKRSKRAFEVLSARIRVGNQPQLVLTTTPAGMNHWLYDIFVKQDFPPTVLKALAEAGYQGKIAEYFHISTEDNKENLDPFYYLSLSAMYSGKTRQQELEGQFVTMEGAVWENLDLSLEGRNCTKFADYTPGVPVEWWVDDGFAPGHPRVILFAQVVPPFINVFDEYVALGELSENSISHALSRPWAKPTVAYVDSSAAEMRSRIWQADIDSVSATHSVEEGIKRTSSWICDANGMGHLRFHPRCSFAIKQMPNYYREEDTQRPVKNDDDVSDAVRYGIWSKDRETIWNSEVPNYTQLLLDQRGAEQALSEESKQREVLEAETDPMQQVLPSGIMTLEGLRQLYYRQRQLRQDYHRQPGRQPTLEEIMRVIEGI